MAHSLFIASTNAGKLRDFQTAASVHGIVIEPIPDLVHLAAPEETGATFAENARLKAVYYSQFAPGEWVLADDSGLAVAALGGAPGVRSARFAADSGLTDSPDANDNTDVWNNMILLQKLARVPLESPVTPDSARRGSYLCALSVARDGVELLTAEGIVNGVILDAPRGTGGFGYDPLFYLPELGLSMAEIDLETKHSLSHRGRAFANLLPRLAGL